MASWVIIGGQPMWVQEDAAEIMAIIDKEFVSRWITLTVPAVSGWEDLHVRPEMIAGVQEKRS